jgi:hypothetical protein
MKSWFYKLFPIFNRSGDQEDLSIQKMATQNAMNRRKNLRVRYPHLGAIGPFPKVYFKEREMIVGNISVGGILLIDDGGYIGTDVSGSFVLTLQFEDKVVRIKSRLMGISGERRHFQFVDFQPQAFLKISQLIKPAHIGQKFYRIRNDSGALNAREMWIGPTAETIVFPHHTETCEIMWEGKKIISSKSGIGYEDQSMKVTRAVCCDLLAMLVNIPHPTTPILELIEMLFTELEHGSRKKAVGEG